MTWAVEWFARSAIGRYLLMGLALLAGVGAYNRVQRRKGRKEAEHEFQQETSRRVEAGREAILRGRGSGLSPAERVRRNDRRWGGM